MNNVQTCLRHNLRRNDGVFLKSPLRVLHPSLEQAAKSIQMSEDGVQMRLRYSHFIAFGEVGYLRADLLDSARTI